MLAGIQAELDRHPEILAEIEGQWRFAKGLLADLDEMQLLADRELMRRVARILAGKAMSFRGDDKIEIKPPREMLDEAVAELKAEIAAPI